jgi:hypothetical protein
MHIHVEPPETVKPSDSVKPPDSFEEHSRALFHDSVDSLDFALRSRLTQARHAAMEAAVASRRRPWFFRIAVLTPAGVTAAAVLGAFLWLGSPMGRHAVTVGDGQANIEDLEIVAADEGAGDAMDMLQDDIEFYDWADKAASSGPQA